MFCFPCSIAFLKVSNGGKIRLRMCV